MSAFTMTAPVGNSLDNDPGDVLGLKKILSNLGFMEVEDSPHGYLTRTLDCAIRAFQDSLGLKATGVVRPGDNTHAALADVAPTAGDEAPPLPGRKPFYVPPPAYRAQVFDKNDDKRAEWQEWVRKTHEDPSLSPTEAAIFRDIFAAEAGMKVDEKGNASARAVSRC